MFAYEKLPNGLYRVYNYLTNETVRICYTEEFAKITILDALYLYGRDDRGEIK